LGFPPGTKQQQLEEGKDWSASNQPRSYTQGSA
jgi:hypothetical protein